MDRFRWKDFKPAIFFVGKFVAVYLIGNILYGFYITAYYPKADPLTIFVTEETTHILNLMDAPVVSYPSDDRPAVVIKQVKPVVSVFEGCNGLNVVIVFLAFMLAFGQMNKHLIWFIPVGIIVIHLTNLSRIGILFFVSRDYPDKLYFFHKYLLTAFVYGAVFLMWLGWIRLNKRTQT
jgi:exosortase family protein XrtF